MLEISKPSRGEKEHSHFGTYREKRMIPLMTAPKRQRFCSNTSAVHLSFLKLYYRLVLEPTILYKHTVSEQRRSRFETEDARASCCSYLADAGPQARVGVHAAPQRAAAGQALGVASVTQGASVAALSGIASLAVTETRQQTWGKREKTRDLFDLSLLLSGMCVRARKATPLGDVTEGQLLRVYLNLFNISWTLCPVWERPACKNKASIQRSEFTEIPVIETF